MSMGFEPRDKWSQGKEKMLFCNGTWWRLLLYNTLLLYLQEAFGGTILNDVTSSEELT